MRGWVVRRIGAWGVLIPAKFWEGRQGDAVLRRFALLGMGLAFGLVAFETGPKLLHIVLENEVAIPHVPIEVMALSTSRGSPKSCGTWPISVSCSCWRRGKQADPLRTSRLSLGSFCVRFGRGAVDCRDLPQPWGVMMAGPFRWPVHCPARGSIRNLRVPRRSLP